MAKSPSSRSKQWLEDGGWVVWNVEQWVPNPGVPAGGVRRDLLNCIDLLAFKPLFPPMGIQVTTQGNANKRLEKMQEMCEEHTGDGLAYPLLWLSTGCSLIIHGWNKLPKNTKRSRPEWVLNGMTLDESDGKLAVMDRWKNR